jgi:transcriptional regulator with XRE-family HTH domain
MLSRTLKTLRLKNRLTQQQVANLLNVDRSTYTYYETGKIKPDVDTLIKLCCIFDTSLETLTGDYNESLQALHNTIDDYLEKGEESQSLGGISRQERRAVLLFRLCPDKEKALSLLKELATSSPACKITDTEENEKINN